MLRQGEAVASEERYVRNNDVQAQHELNGKVETKLHEKADALENPYCWTQLAIDTKIPVPDLELGGRLTAEQTRVLTQAKVPLQSLVEKGILEVAPRKKKK